MSFDPIRHVCEPRRALVLITGFCLAALTGALYAQYGLGLDPCILCIWQRIPYAAIGLLSLVALLPVMPGWVPRLTLGLAALGFVTEAGIAIFHMGVEAHWWEGTDGCSDTLPLNLSIEEMKKALMATPPARCDEVGWSIFGISITVYNSLASLAAAGFAAAAWFFSTGRESR